MGQNDAATRGELARSNRGRSPINLASEGGDSTAAGTRLTSTTDTAETKGQTTPSTATAEPPPQVLGGPRGAIRQNWTNLSGLPEKGFYGKFVVCLEARPDGPRRQKKALQRWYGVVGR